MSTLTAPVPQVATEQVGDLVFEVFQLRVGQSELSECAQRLAECPAEELERHPVGALESED
jgi:hypothetical protein